MKTQPLTREDTKAAYQSAEAAYQLNLAGYLTHNVSYQDLKKTELAKNKAFKVLAAIIKKQIKP